MRDDSPAAPAPARGSDDRLELAARYIYSVRSASGGPRRVRAALDRPGIAALVGLLRSLPTVEAPFSDTEAGRELRSWFRPERRLPVDRAAVGVLNLPATYAEYLRGRSRQALRTNLARAAKSGIVCRDLSDENETRRVCEHIAGVRGTMAEDYLRPNVVPGPDSVLCAAYDEAGDPVALSHLVIDGDWAGLGFMVTANDRDDAHLARYALHAHMVSALVDRRISTFVVGGCMLIFKPGIRYFQRRTGFEPVRLRLLPLRPVQHAAVEDRTALVLAGLPAQQLPPALERIAVDNPSDASSGRELQLTGGTRAGDTV